MRFDLSDYQNKSWGFEKRGHLSEKEYLKLAKEISKFLIYSKNKHSINNYQ